MTHPLAQTHVESLSPALANLLQLSPTHTTSLPAKLSSGNFARSSKELSISLSTHHAHIDTERYARARIDTLAV